MEPIVIRFQTKRSLRGILAQHAMAGVALLITVLTVLGEQENPHTWLMIVKAALAVGLIIAIILEYRHIHKGRHAPFPWVDILDGAIPGVSPLVRSYMPRGSSRSYPPPLTV